MKYSPLQLSLFLQISLPKPCLRPSSKDPSYSSTPPKVSLPKPSFLPFFQWPSQTTPECSSSLPLPCLSPWYHCPTQLSPLRELSTPYPSLLPLTNSPSQMQLSGTISKPLPLLPPSSLPFSHPPMQNFPEQCHRMCLFWKLKYTQFRYFFIVRLGSSFCRRGRLNSEYTSRASPTSYSEFSNGFRLCGSFGKTSRLRFRSSLVRNWIFQMFEMLPGVSGYGSWITMSSRALFMSGSGYCAGKFTYTGYTYTFRNLIGGTVLGSGLGRSFTGIPVSDADICGGIFNLMGPFWLNGEGSSSGLADCLLPLRQLPSSLSTCILMGSLLWCSILFSVSYLVSYFGLTEMNSLAAYFCIVLKFSVDILLRGLVLLFMRSRLFRVLLWVFRGRNTSLCTSIELLCWGYWLIGTNRDGPVGAYPLKNTVFMSETVFLSGPRFEGLIYEGICYLPYSELVQPFKLLWLSPVFCTFEVLSSKLGSSWDVPCELL